MFTPTFTNKFKKDYQQAIKRGWNMDLFESTLDLLLKDGSLPSSYKPHTLTGNWKGFWDAHIQPDWVLIYQVNRKTMEVHFIRMGSHSDLF